MRIGGKRLGTIPRRRHHTSGEHGASDGHTAATTARTEPHPACPMSLPAPRTNLA